MKNICVFCGSSSGYNPHFTQKAKELGELIARQNMRLIYGGGNVGLMGELADAVLAQGGEVTGVIPKFLFNWEIGHQGVTELIQVESMHERKLMMSKLSDGFIAMPGGFGTLEELAETLTWIQLSILLKPIGILNIDGFYNHLIAQLDHMVHEGLLKQKNRDLIQVSTDPVTLLETMQQYQFGDNRTKWVSSKQS